MPKREDEEEDTWSQIKNAVAPYFDPAVQAKQAIEEEKAARGGGPSQYEQDMQNPYSAKKKFQKGFSGN